jgi:hypothetical protein
MKLFKYSLVVLLFPCLTWGSSHVVNQAYFLNQTPDKTWNKKDPIFCRWSRQNRNWGHCQSAKKLSSIHTDLLDAER